MRHRYSYLDPDLIRQLLAQMGLRRLFNHLLLQSGGDVEEAMRWMRLLQERGYIDPNVDLDAFFAQLLEQNIIGQDGQGNLVLASRRICRSPPEARTRFPCPSCPMMFCSRSCAKNASRSTFGSM